MNRSTIRTLVLSSLLFAPLAATPTVASSSTTDAPLTLEWRPLGAVAPWQTGPLALSDHPFIALRVTGDEDRFAGHWIEISGRVWFHPDFFTSGVILDGDYIVADFADFDLANGNLNPAGWDISTAPFLDPIPAPGDPGVELDPNITMPACFIPNAFVDGMLERNGVYDTGENDLVMLQSQPLLSVPGVNTITSRNWTLQYHRWSTDSLSYWRDVNGNESNPRLISTDAIIKRLVLDMKPDLTPSFFTTSTWSRILELGVGLQLQAVAMIGQGVDSTNFPSADDDPPAY